MVIFPTTAEVLKILMQFIILSEKSQTEIFLQYSHAETTIHGEFMRKTLQIILLVRTGILIIHSVLEVYGVLSLIAVKISLTTTPNTGILYAVMRSEEQKLNLSRVL